MSFPKYPKYKDSGVEWLGEVPEHWSIISIKWLSPVKRGASPRPIDDPKYFDDEGEFAWVRITDVSACDGVLKETTQRLSDLGSSLSVKIAPGELFVSIAGTVGKPCLSGIKACIHDGFVYFPTLQIAPQFLYRIFEAGTCYGGLGKWGTQLNLNTDTIGSIRVAMPPDNEQAQILEFLDRETAKIDELVAEQRRLIELLKEKRQAVISHAVTKGLNPHAPMKPSGIEWPLEIPVEWTVKRIKYLVTASNGIQMGPFGGMLLDLDAEETGFKVYGQENTITGDFSLGRRWISKNRFIALANYHVDIGDLLLTRKGSLGNARLVIALPWPGIIDSDTIRIRVDKRQVVPTFIATLLHEARYVSEQITLTKRGAILPGLNSETIANISIILPPIEQQREVLEFMATAVSGIDDEVKACEQAIDLLQERRTALISAAVTGKIDVRGLAEFGAA
jgi:type I restriction enzyme S subunit